MVKHREDDNFHFIFLSVSVIRVGLLAKEEHDVFLMEYLNGST